MASFPPPPLPSLSISGLTLASLLHLAAASPSDACGLLSGHLSLPSLPPPPSDDFSSDSAPPSPPSLFLSHLLSFPSPSSILSSLNPNSPFLSCPNPNSSILSSSILSSSSPVVGWFSYRRNSLLHPSMRELEVSISLSKTLTLESESRSRSDLAFVFLLLSSSVSPNRAVHTHSYRAFVLDRNGNGKQGLKLKPVSLRVVNVGPSSSGGQYGNFAPEMSVFPFVPCDLRTDDGHFNLCNEGEKKKSKKEETLGTLKEKAQDQKILDLVSDGFGVERLEKLVTGNSHTNELDDLYCNMLSKLESLARQVEKSTARVSEQENRNLELRCKLGGME